MFDSGTPSVADIAAVTGNNANCFGDNGGWWVLILLFFLFGGWGRNCFNGGNNCGCDSATATVGDVERGFNQQSTNMRFNAVDNAFAQLGYSNLQQFANLSNGLCQLGYQTQDAVNGLSRQIADCCCGVERNIDSVNYNISQGFANQGYQLQQCCCDLTNTMNANTQRVIDQISQFRMEDKNDTIAELRSQVQALNLAQSQANQNQYLLSRLQPAAVPAYQVANPYASYGCCNAQAACCC